jgi:hypothetical protein
MTHGLPDSTKTKQALEHDGTKTDQLGDTYRRLVALGASASPARRAARRSAENRPPEEQRRKAEEALRVALVELKTAAAAVFDRIKAGENLPTSELDREWKARVEVMQARRLLKQLQLRKTWHDAPP